MKVLREASIRSPQSFGVPMLAPIAPFTKRSRDIILMRPTHQRKKRPDQFDPLQVSRQPKTSQSWKTEQQKPGNAPILTMRRMNETVLAEDRFRFKKGAIFKNDRFKNKKSFYN